MSRPGFYAWDGRPATTRTTRDAELGGLIGEVISMTGEPIPPSVRPRVVTVDPLVLAVSTGHPFAGRRHVRVSQLEDRLLITLEEGTGLRAAVRAACRDAGFSPRVVAETTEIRSLLHLTAGE